MNMPERALEHARQAVKLTPNDQRLKNNLNIIERAVKSSR